MLTLFDPTTINPNGTLTNSGTIEIGGNDINSVVTVNGNLTNSGAVLQTPFLNQAGYQTFGAALRVQGTFTNQSTGTLSLSTEPGVLPEEFDVPHLSASELLNYGTATVGQYSTVNTQILENQSSLAIGGQVSTGTLIIGGPGGTGVLETGSLTVGTGSTPTAPGGYQQFANGTLVFTGLDGIGAAGSISLNGTLDIMLGDNAKPVGSGYAIATGGPITGTFSRVEGLVFDGGRQHYVLDYDSANNAVTLVVEDTVLPEPSSALLFVLGLAALGPICRFRYRSSKLH